MPPKILMLEVHLKHHAGVNEYGKEVHCAGARLPRARIGTDASVDHRGEKVLKRMPVYRRPTGTSTQFDQSLRGGELEATYSSAGPEHSVARDIDNFWYKVARLALTEPSPGGYLRRLRWAGEVLQELSSAGADVFAITRKHLLAECNAVVINEADGLTYLRECFDALFDRLQVSYLAFDMLAEDHDAFFASSEARLQRLRADGVDAIGDLIFFKKAFQTRSGILVSTIHGVKGAEFDVVIAHTLLEGMVPHFNDAAGDDSAKKLLYVVGSRARKNLHMFSETGRSRGRAATTHRPDCWQPASFHTTLSRLRQKSSARQRDPNRAIGSIRNYGGPEN
ncbi:3'-5' exonuclease [Variovorax sp. LT1R20]|uniref:3'-5' exonuclease n=1 Tax=Variovorax sp. LT1R20 TaxID=3443729 RepID=UPI003F46399D